MKTADEFACRISDRIVRHVPCHFILESHRLPGFGRSSKSLRRQELMLQNLPGSEDVYESL